MGDIITSSVRGEQPSQLSSIMPLPGYNSCRRHKTVQVQWNTLIYCNWRGRFVSGNCHYLCHWTVSSEDSCTRCTNGVGRRWHFGCKLWCTIINLNITINKWKCVKISAFKTFEVWRKIFVTWYFMYWGVS
jgi:hypothetical protein